MHTITMAEVLIGGVRAGQGASMREDIVAAGIAIAAHDDGEPLRLAELRASTGLKLPDCCVLDVAMRHQASLATFDAALAVQAAKRGVSAAYGVSTKSVSVPNGTGRNDLRECYEEVDGSC